MSDTQPAHRPCRRFAMQEGNPVLYLVYDYMDGGDLGRALAVPTGLSLSERVKVCERPFPLFSTLACSRSPVCACSSVPCV